MAAQALSPPRRQRMTELPEGLLAYVLLAPAAAVLIGLVAYPLVDGVATAFTDRAVARAGKFVGFANFAELWGDPIFRLAVWNSVYMTLGAVAVKLVLGLTGAMVLSQEFPLRGLVRALVFLPWAVPGLVAGLTWKWIYDEQAGILNYLLIAGGLTEGYVYWLSDPAMAKISIIIANVWHGLPFFIMMFLAGLAAIPKELNEAAAIDGAGAWGRLWRVTLPQLKDVIAITVMLSTIWTFNSFHMVFILTGGGPAYRTHILPTLAYEYGIGRSRLGMGAAVMVAVIPVFMVIIALLTRRMLRSKDA